MSATKEGISEQQMAERRRGKIQELRDNGIDPYPSKFIHREPIRLAKNGSRARVAGRIIAQRDLGKILFVEIEDQSDSVELHINSDCEPRIVVENLSLGDLIGAAGDTGTNRQGERMIECSHVMLLAKAIREPPDKHHGLLDDNFRYRHREVEMFSDRSVRELFILRSKVIAYIRRYLEDSSFIEVETPVLQPVYGGATARPFTTKHNTLNRASFLRISSELYLKRYMVGGMDQVFHIGKSFRNEGISPEHSPEFTMIEFFQSCVDDDYMQNFTVGLIDGIFRKFKNEAAEISFDICLPSADWPLSRKNKISSNVAEAWEMYIGDMEIASGASDLNDPDEQKERLLRGLAANVDDFTEANPYDETYIQSLEYGLMPISGVGIGIDRLMMLLTGKDNLREVVAFPAMR